MSSVFAKYEEQHYPYRYTIGLHLPCIVGGTPTDPKVAEGWIKTFLADKDDLIRDAVIEVMATRDVSAEEATTIVSEAKHLSGFKRDEEGLYIEGRQLKACIKEAASVARAANKLKKEWGMTRKGVLGFTAEHIFVIEDRLHLGTSTPTGINQRFIHKYDQGSKRYISAIQYEEYVEDAKITATIESDHEFTDEEWAALWLTAERQGLGASRSQGFGRFTVTQWDRQA
jgi:hypothetical protein